MVDPIRDIAPTYSHFFAHSANETTGRWHPLSEHLQSVSALAAEFAASFGYAEEAYAAGLLHDLGKYSDRFQQRLKNPAVVKGINHWTVGALQCLLLRRIPAAFAAAGHHCGMPSRIDLALQDKASGVNWKEATTLDEPLDTLIARFVADGMKLPSPGQPPAIRDETDVCLLSRLIFSCLVDADFLDTERHFEPVRSDQRPCQPLKSAQWLDLLLQETRRKSQTHSLVNKIREQVQRSCLEAAATPPGLFSLTVPTGGGKTLASMAFALKHAALHPDFRRVILVLPYTSIIEQSAQVYAEIFGSEAVLEHHSARDEAADQETETRYRLAFENWDAPIIVTSQVQFFESLFSNRPGPSRKLHRIARSVLIFDEIQTLTGPLLRPLLRMIQALSRVAKCTAVLCTATPNSLGPASEKLGIPGWSPREIIDDPGELSKKLELVRIEMPPDLGVATPLKKIAELMSCEPQALCILNRKDDAEDLFRLLPPEGRFHLSTRMCPAHRSEVLEAVKSALVTGQPCRLSATQCVEAGVDIDFPQVFRAMGPLDSILQAAGRCNREGKRPPADSKVTVFVSERRPPQGTYGVATLVTQLFLNLAKNDFLNPDRILQYYALLFDGRLNLDRVEDRSGHNVQVRQLEKEMNFPAIADAVRLIAQDTVPVIVPYGGGKDACDAMQAKSFGPAPDRHERRRLAQFSVQLYRSQAEQGIRDGTVLKLRNGIMLWKGEYDHQIGCVFQIPAEQMIL